MASISKRRRLAQWIHLCPVAPNFSRNRVRNEVDESLKNMLLFKAPKRHSKLNNKLSILQTETTTALSSTACYFATLVCTTSIILIGLMSNTLAVQAAPNPLGLVTKIASVGTQNSPKSNSPTPPHLVKSARLATYSLSCPPEASIHPCTCVYHSPDTQIESEEEEEEVYEISPSITTPYAELLVRTSTAAPQSPPPLTQNSQKPSELNPNLATKPGHTERTKAEPTTAPPPPPTTTTTTTTISTTVSPAQTQTSSMPTSTQTTTQATQTTPAPTTTTTTVPTPTSTSAPVTITTTSTLAPSTFASVANSMSTAPGDETVTSSPLAISTLSTKMSTLSESTPTMPRLISNQPSLIEAAAAADMTSPSTEAPAPRSTAAPIIASSQTIALDNAAKNNTNNQLAEFAPKVDSNLVELVSLGMTAASSITTTPTTIETTTTARSLPNANESVSIKLPEPTSTTAATTTTTSAPSTQASSIGLASGTIESTPEPAGAIVSMGQESRIGNSDRSDLINLQDIGKITKDGGIDEDDELSGDTTMTRLFSKENTFETNSMSAASFAEPLVMTSAASPAPPTTSPPLVSSTNARDPQERPFEHLTTAAPTPTSVTPLAETIAASSIVPSSMVPKSTPMAQTPEQAIEAATELALSLKATTPAPTSSSLSSNKAASPSTPSLSATETAPTSTTESTKMLVSTAMPTTEGTTTSRALPSSPSPPLSSTTTTTTTTTSASASTTVTSTTVMQPTTLEPSSTTTTTTTPTPPTSTTAPASITISLTTAAPRSTSTTTLLTTADPTLSTTPALASSSTSKSDIRTTTTAYAPYQDAAGARAGTVTPAPSIKPAMSTIAGDSLSSGSRRPQEQRQQHHHQNNQSSSSSQANGMQQAANSSRAHNERPISAGRAIQQSRPMTTNLTSTGASSTARPANATGNQHNHNAHNQSISHHQSQNNSNNNHSQNQQPPPSSSSSSSSSQSQSQNGRQILTPNTHRVIKPSSSSSATAANLSNHRSNASHQTSLSRNQSAPHPVTTSGLLNATTTSAPPISPAASLANEPLSRSTRAATANHSHGNHNQSLPNRNTAQHRPLYPNSARQQNHRQQQQHHIRHRPTPRPDESNESINTSSQRLPGGRRLTRYLAPHQQDGGDSSGESKVEVVAYCRNIQNPQVLRSAIKGFRGHQVNYFVIDSCKVPPFPNDLFHSIDVRWLEMLNSTVQFHNNFLHGHHHQQQQQHH